MFEKVKEKLLEYVEYPAEQITEETCIVKDMAMNSFDIVTMLGDLEDEYGVSFEEEALENIVTVGDLVKKLTEMM